MVAKSKKSGAAKRQDEVVEAVAVTAPEATAGVEASATPVEAPISVDEPTSVEAPTPVKAPASVKLRARATDAAAEQPAISFGSDEFAVMIQANAALVRGFEEMGQEVAGFAQRNVAAAVDAARAMVGVRTVADLVEINRSLAQSTLEGVIANSARLSEIGIRVATEAFEPLNDRLATTLGLFGRKVA